jgi:hypothetical protein
VSTAPAKRTAIDREIDDRVSGIVHRASSRLRRGNEPAGAACASSGNRAVADFQSRTVGAAGASGL